MPKYGETPDSKIACGRGARRALLHATDSGTAGKRITAFGLHLRGTRLRLLERHDLGIDALLAHPGGAISCVHLAAENRRSEILSCAEGHRKKWPEATEGRPTLGLAGLGSMGQAITRPQGRPGNPENPSFRPSLRAKRSNPRFFLRRKDGLLRRKALLANDGFRNGPRLFQHRHDTKNPSVPVRRAGSSGVPRQTEVSRV